MLPLDYGAPPDFEHTQLISTYLLDVLFDVSAVEQIVKHAKYLVNDQKSDGFTALHIACINDHREAADVLISKVYSLRNCHTVKFNPSS